MKTRISKTYLSKFRLAVSCPSFILSFWIARSRVFARNWIAFPWFGSSWIALEKYLSASTASLFCSFLSPISTKRSGLWGALWIAWSRISNAFQGNSNEAKNILQVHRIWTLSFFSFWCSKEFISSCYHHIDFCFWLDHIWLVFLTRFDDIWFFFIWWLENWISEITWYSVTIKYTIRIELVLRL